MSSLTKEESRNWLIGLGVSALAFVGFKVAQLNNVKNNFGLALNFSVASVSIKEIVIRVIVTFKNPSRGSVSVSHPFVSIYANQEDLRNNSPSGISDLPTDKAVKYQVKGGLQKQFDPIIIRISTAKALFKIGKIIINYLDLKPITLYAKAVLQVNGVIPVEEIQSKTFTKKPVEQ